MSYNLVDLHTHLIIVSLAIRTRSYFLSRYRFIKFRESDTSDIGLELPTHHSFEYILHIFQRYQDDINQNTSTSNNNQTIISNRSTTSSSSSSSSNIPKNEITPVITNGSSTLSSTSVPLSTTTVPPIRLSYIDLVTSFRNASATLRNCIRVADTFNRYDTITLSPQALGKGAEFLWRQLDDASLGALATMLPSKDQLDRTGSQVTTFWFSTAGAYSVGSFIANRLELALLKEFRTRTEAQGRLQRILKPDEPAGTTVTSSPTSYASSVSSPSVSTSSHKNDGEGSLLSPHSHSTVSSSSSTVMTTVTNKSKNTGKGSINNNSDSKSKPSIVSTTTVMGSDTDNYSSSSTIYSSLASSINNLSSNNTVTNSTNNPNNVPPGLQLVSKIHLATLWDKLTTKDRICIIQGDDSNVGIVNQKTNPRELIEKISRNTPSKGTTETILKGNGNSIPVTNLSKLSSSQIQKLFPGSTSVDSTEAGTHDNENDGDSGSLSTTPRDLNTLTPSDLFKTFPYEMAIQDGLTVVQSLYLHRLDTIESPECDIARQIGFRLQGWWAEMQAMDLINSEETHDKRRTKGGSNTNPSTPQKNNSSGSTNENTGVSSSSSSTGNSELPRRQRAGSHSGNMTMSKSSPLTVPGNPNKSKEKDDASSSSGNTVKVSSSYANIASGQSKATSPLMKTPTRKEVPVVVSTANSSPEDEESESDHDESIDWQQPNNRRDRREKERQNTATSKPKHSNPINTTLLPQTSSAIRTNSSKSNDKVTTMLGTDEVVQRTNSADKTETLRSHPVHEDSTKTNTNRNVWGSTSTSTGSTGKISFLQALQGKSTVSVPISASSDSTVDPLITETETSSHTIGNVAETNVLPHPIASSMTVSSKASKKADKNAVHNSSSAASSGSIIQPTSNGNISTKIPITSSSSSTTPTTNVPTGPNIKGTPERPVKSWTSFAQTIRSGPSVNTVSNGKESEPSIDKTIPVVASAPQVTVPSISTPASPVVTSVTVPAITENEELVSVNTKPTTEIVPLITEESALPLTGLSVDDNSSSVHVNIPKESTESSTNISVSPMHPVASLSDSTIPISVSLPKEENPFPANDTSTTTTTEESGKSNEDIFNVSVPSVTTSLSHEIEATVAVVKKDPPSKKNKGNKGNPPTSTETTVSKEEAVVLSNSLAVKSDSMVITEPIVITKAVPSSTVTNPPTGTSSGSKKKNKKQKDNTNPSANGIPNGNRSVSANGNLTNNNNNNNSNNHLFCGSILPQDMNGGRPTIFPNMSMGMPTQGMMDPSTFSIAAAAQLQSMFQNYGVPPGMTNTSYNVSSDQMKNNIPNNAGLPSPLMMGFMNSSSMSPQGYPMSPYFNNSMAMNNISNNNYYMFNLTGMSPSTNGSPPTGNQIMLTNMMPPFFPPTGSGPSSTATVPVPNGAPSPRNRTTGRSASFSGQGSSTASNNGFPPLPSITTTPPSTNGIIYGTNSIIPTFIPANQVPLGLLSNPSTGNNLSPSTNVPPPFISANQGPMYSLGPNMFQPINNPTSSSPVMNKSSDSFGTSDNLNNVRGPTPPTIVTPTNTVGIPLSSPTSVPLYPRGVTPTEMSPISGSRTATPNRISVTVPPLTPIDLLVVSPETGVPLWVEYQLHAELLKLQTWCVAHAHFRRMQELRVVWDIAKLAQETVQNTPWKVAVHVFGSFMTGLATPSSDVDVLVRVLPKENTSVPLTNFSASFMNNNNTMNGTQSGSDIIAQNERNRNFPLLAQNIRGKPWARNVHAIPTAHVPVIKVVADPPPWEPLPYSQPVQQPNPLPNLVSADAFSSSRINASTNGKITDQETTTTVTDLPLEAFSLDGDDHPNKPLDTSVSSTSHTVIAAPITPRSSRTRDPVLARLENSSSNVTRSPSLKGTAGMIQSLTSPSGSPRLTARRNSISSPSGTVNRQSSSTGTMTNNTNDSSTNIISLNNGPTTNSLPIPLLPGLSRCIRNGWFNPEAPIRLDITFHTPTHRGDQTTSFTRMLLSSNPALGPLTLAVKLLLAGHGLNDAFTGGLSSFGMLLITYVYLQHTSRIIKATAAATGTFAALHNLIPYERDRNTLPQSIQCFPNRPLQPGDGRSFYEVAEPYAIQPLELCGSLPALAASPLPVPMVLVPPDGLITVVPHVVIHKGKIPSGMNNHPSGTPPSLSSGNSLLPPTPNNNGQNRMFNNLNSNMNSNNNNLMAQGGIMMKNNNNGRVSSITQTNSDINPTGTNTNNGTTMLMNNPVNPTTVIPSTATTTMGGNFSTPRPFIPYPSYPFGGGTSHSTTGNGPLSPPGTLGITPNYNGNSNNGSSFSSFVPYPPPPLPSSTVDNSINSTATLNEQQQQRGIHIPAGLRPIGSSFSSPNSSNSPVKSTTEGITNTETEQIIKDNQRPPAVTVPPPTTKDDATPTISRLTSGIQSAPSTPFHSTWSGSVVHPHPNSSTTTVPIHNASLNTVIPPHRNNEENESINPTVNDSTISTAASSSTPKENEEYYVEGGDDPTYFQSPLFGRYFLKLLRFYGEEFTAPQTTCIDAATGSMFSTVHDLVNGTNGTAAALAAGIIDPVNIPDPMDRKQNVGRNCFRWFQVQVAFREAYRTLVEHAKTHPPSKESLKILSTAIANGKYGIGWNPQMTTTKNTSNGTKFMATLQPGSIGYTRSVTAEPEVPEFPLLSHILSAVRGL